MLRDKLCEEIWETKGGAVERRVIESLEGQYGSA